MPDGPRRRMAMLLIREIVLMLAGAFIGAACVSGRSSQVVWGFAIKVIAGALIGLVVHFCLPRK